MAAANLFNYQRLETADDFKQDFKQGDSLDANHVSRIVHARLSALQEKIATLEKANETSCCYLSCCCPKPETINPSLDQGWVVDYVQGLGNEMHVLKLKLKLAEAEKKKAELLLAQHSAPATVNVVTTVLPTSDAALVEEITSMKQAITKMEGAFQGESLSKRQQFLQKDNNDRNALHHAVLDKDHEGVLFLSKYKELLEVRDNEQVSNFCENRKDKSGNTPLLLAAMKGTAECCQILLQAGANPAAANRDGRNVLHLAVKYSSAPVLKLLLENQKCKELLEVKDHDGNTAYGLARQISAPQVREGLCKILRDAGAKEETGVPENPRYGGCIIL